MNKRNATILGCGIGLVLFVAVNILSGATLRSWRLDLTEEKLFTLADGSKKIAGEIQEPINLYYYFSEEAASEHTMLNAYGERVREVLEEFVLASGDQIRLELLDPIRFSEEEDQAVAEGLFGAPISDTEIVYMGLVGTNTLDDKEVIPFFDPSKERFLEYEVAKLIYALANPIQDVLGIISGLPIEGSPGNPMMGQQGTPGLALLGQIDKFYEMKMLGTEIEEIPDDVSQLLIIHPKELGDPTLYAIDQFVLSGKPALVFVDPWAEADLSTADPQNPMARGGAPSDLEPLFQAWGLEMVDGKFAADRRNAQRVRVSQQSNDSVPFVAWVRLTDDTFNEDDAVTSLLTSLQLATPGILQPVEGATTEFEPLVLTSEETMRMDTGTVQFMPDPNRMLEMFLPEHEPLTVAARISGTASSAFPNGKPELFEEEPAEEESEEDGGESAAAHLTESSGPINVIVFADTDMLQDRWWVRENRLGPISLGYEKLSDNGDFVLNALENQAGGEDLISIRAQGRSQRPFTVVDEIRRDSDQKFRAEEQRLQRELDTAQSRINELQREKTDDQLLILSAEQQAEIDRITEQQVETRKKLRQVKLDLKKDVELLGMKVKLANVALLPVVITIGAVVLGAMRLLRRTAAREKAIARS